MITFKQFILEGGNIKVGDVAAAPFGVTAANRAEKANDIKQALHTLHNTFHKATEQHLFGKDKAALHAGSVYSGSTKHLMDKNISDQEFAKHKPKVGDVDIQIPHEHKDALADHLTKGLKVGKYTVAGVKKHGNEVSAIMKHENGEHHQFDFEGTEYKNHQPTEGDQFIHNSSWEDTKAGIKGVHHKMLINAAGGSQFKFSNTHGLKKRTDAPSDKGTKHPTEVSKSLFGDKADHSKVQSFHGVAQLIKKHIPADQHQAVYDKFKDSVKSKKKIDSEKALSHLKGVLGAKDSTNESLVEQKVHHTSVIPIVGFSPISHMGHSHDLGSALGSLPGKKHIGISGKADLFSPEERTDIMKRQWAQHGDFEHHIVRSAGETVAKAFHSLPKDGKKHLHILVGADRAELAHGLKRSLESGKIKEMGDNKFDNITVHFPEDKERTHGMSGTKMRTAAASGDHKTFSKHLGSMFSKEESLNIMNKVRSGLESGKIKVKR
jgi:hypothetical protein